MYFVLSTYTKLFWIISLKSDFPSGNFFTLSLLEFRDTTYVSILSSHRYHYQPKDSSSLTLLRNDNKKIHPRTFLLLSSRTYVRDLKETTKRILLIHQKTSWNPPSSFILCGYYILPAYHFKHVINRCIQNTGCFLCGYKILFKNANISIHSLYQ